MAEILYPTNDAQVHRHSSIDQFSDFLSVWKQGGWAPIVFDQLDGIGECSGLHTHPVVISFENNGVDYVFPESHCTYSSDHFITADKVGVEERLLPECFGGEGEFYQEYVSKNTFINFDGAGGGDSLGIHNDATLRGGLDYCLAEETLPAVE